MKSQNKNSGSVLSVGIIFFLILIVSGWAGAAETYHLKGGSQWQKIDQGGNEYILAVSNIKKLIAESKHKKAAKAIDELKAAFDDLVGEDLDALVEAELLFAKKKLIKASRKYEEFLDSYPDSSFYESAMERQFTIADTFIKGRKRTVLGILRLHAYEEADNIMHDIADRSGDAPIAKRALTTLAKGYQKRNKYIEAYDVWAEMSSRWPTGELGKTSLLEMAQSLHSAYKGPKYDSSSLGSARSYYEDFKARYPQEVSKYDIDEKIQLVDEQLAYKEFEIARYYSRAELPEAASLYYQHAEDSWPETTAAKMASEVIEQQKAGQDIIAVKKTAERKLFDLSCLFLDNWFGLSAIGSSN
ncbi:MAG: outer membrane protein assembly factor BamD [Phycisphaerae bacterium]|nr:outer membrane protein assembly factor BamD [Phycisphaerae bacterium]